MKKWILWLAGVATAFGQTPPALEEALLSLDEPITVQTRVGRDFQGYPVATERDSLTLRVAVDGGSAELTFPRDDVLRVRFPGNTLKQRALDLAEAGDWSGALDLIDRLFAQRSAFFPYVGESEARFFAETLGLYRRADRTFEGLARAELIRPYIHEAALLRSIEKEQLLGAHLLGLDEQARGQAQAWIARDGREPETALPALILATRQLAARDGDGALFTLLHPVVFSGARRIEYLDLCYAFAIGLADALERPDVARPLRLERDLRGLTPPKSWAPLAPPDFSILTSLPPPS